MLKLGWFSTGRGPGSRELLHLVQEEILSRRLDAGIEFVFSNREPGEAEGSDEFFRLVQSYGLPLATFSSKRFHHGKSGELASHRNEYGREVMHLLEGFNPDICVLAGYMLVVSGEMCHRYPMINLHPALPEGPMGTWQEVIWQLIETQAQETGAMIHLVTEDVDRGPVITYSRFPIRGKRFDSLWLLADGQSVQELMREFGVELPLFKLIRSEVVRRESPLLLETLKALVRGTVRVEGRQVLDATGAVTKGYCLNQELEGYLDRPTS